MNGVQKGGNVNVAGDKPGRNLLNQEIKENITSGTCKDIVLMWE